jgi:opacity protein-like surface antigen
MEEQMSIARILLVSLLILSMSAAAAQAQDKRWELIPFVGFTASSGVDIRSQDIGDGRFVNYLAPKSGFSYGGLVNFMLGENFSVGFLFNQQRSNLEGIDTSAQKIKFTDMSVNNYHGVFTYNWGDEDSEIRPYILFGLGATQYRPADIQGTSVDSRTRFSPTLGGGVKFFPSEFVGFQAGARWTSTYIRSDPGGVWCSPYWPWSCWVLSNDHFSHQGEFSGGVIFRF